MRNSQMKSKSNYSSRPVYNLACHRRGFASGNLPAFVPKQGWRTQRLADSRDVATYSAGTV